MNDQQEIIKIVLESYQKNHAYIHLLLTEQCNYKCGHCMYDCGPDKSSLYMSDDILQKAKKQIKFLNSCNIPVVVNLIGGEPTLNFNEFERIFKEVSTWDCSLVSTTNAWWIDNDELVNRFFDIIGSKVNSLRLYKQEKGFNRVLVNKFINIRISTDEYHSKQQKIENLDDKLIWIFNNSKKFKELNLPIPDKDFRWITTQSQDIKDLNQAQIVFPNGRGKNKSTLNEFFKKNKISGNFCFSDNPLAQIHYNPNGVVMDGCGRGSIYDFGSVNDNILYLAGIIWRYKLNRYYLLEKKYNCYNCRDMVKNWKKDNLIKVREEFSKFNTMDYDKFMKEINL
jgi:organic radical activating enzyme